MQYKKIAVLNTLLSQIEGYIPHLDKSNPTISKASVGWQLDHMLKVINKVSESLKRSNPKDFKKDFNIMRCMLFPFCYIPRGGVKSPKIVLPPDVIVTTDLYTQLDEAKQHISNMTLLDKNAHFKHFIFGTLSKIKTLRFLEMHTKHHLKIVRGIMNE